MADHLILRRDSVANSSWSTSERTRCRSQIARSARDHVDVVRHVVDADDQERRAGLDAVLEQDGQDEPVNSRIAALCTCPPVDLAFRRLGSRCSSSSSSSRSSTSDEPSPGQRGRGVRGEVVAGVQSEQAEHALLVVGQRLVGQVEHGVHGAVDGG